MLLNKICLSSFALNIWMIPARLVLIIIIKPIILNCQDVNGSGTNPSNQPNHQFASTFKTRTLVVLGEDVFSLLTTV